MRLGLYQEKIIWLALCAPLFALTHLANAWLFNHFVVDYMIAVSHILNVTQCVAVSRECVLNQNSVSVL